ncbi:uncharacterized protein LOC100876750 [Megachile rotundata]|uniref:uncharacterized protein LOC100876750 n=1 Tax=Megachile rotundata TaxID=143995 RepID=UPI000614E530|nr:PREDICTED: odorant receptor 2a-like [Megachile rotundata]
MSNEFMVQKFISQKELDGLSDYSLQLNRWLLKPIGVWPKSFYTSNIEKIVSLISNMICYCSIVITVVPCILHLTFEDIDFRTKLKVFGPMTHWFAGGINYTTLLVRGEEIRHCMKQMQNDWRTVSSPEVQQVMLKDAKFGRNMATFCTVFMQGGVLCYCAAMALTKEIVQVGNETRTIHTLPIAVYKKLIPVDTSPTNEIVLAVQVLAAIIVNCTVVGAFSLAIVFAAHAHGQLDVLNMWITEFVDQSRNSSKKVRWNGIGVFVNNHTNVLSFIEHIEHVMNVICFTELCQCTMSICFLCYYILTEWHEHDIHNLTTYVIILVSVTFNVFIMCYVGELLTKQCNRIADVIYSTNWYYLPCKNVLDLTVIITRSSMVTKITAGKIIYMSMYTFGAVLKTSFTYLNILRQMT